MKPLKLEIAGINSFTEPQTIDFVRLAENNLFCISGVTGSGKTTILDSLILGLYERLPASSSRGNIEDYINLRCEKAVIKLTFELDGTVYRTERVISRKKGNNSVRLIDVCTGVAVCEKSNDAFSFLQEKLGLSVEQFTRVIVLQQGEFAQFLKAKKAERNEMVMKLFKLGRFDGIFSKFNEAANKTADKAESLKSELARYADKTAAALADLEKEARACERELKKCDKAIAVLSSELQNAAELERAMKEYDAAVEKKKDLDAKRASLEKDIIAQKEIEKQCEKFGAVRDERKKEKERYIAEIARLEQEKKQIAEIAAAEQSLKAKRETYRRKCAETEAKLAEVNALTGEVNKYMRLAGTYANMSASDLSAVLAKIDAAIKEKKADESALKETENNLVAAGKSAEEAAEQLERAKCALSPAESEVDKREAEYVVCLESAGAEALRRNLKEGDACPVCGEKVRCVPECTAHADIAAAERALSTAKEALSAARVLCEKRSKEEITAKNAVEKYSEQKAEIMRKLSLYEQDLGEKRIACASALENVAIAEQKRTALIKSRTEYDGMLLLLNEMKNRGIEERRELDSRKAKLTESDASKIDALTDNYAKIIASMNREESEYEAAREKSERRKTEIAREESAIETALAAVAEVIGLKPRVPEKPSALLSREIDSEQTRVRDLTEKKAKNMSDAERMRADLEIKRSLEKEFTEINKKHEKFALMSKLLSRGEFNAFVATEYIKDFTFAASQTLFELTGGKYTLSYEEAEGDFYVADFLSGNEKRKAQTLSGGETFLTSLSMAIALSQEISRYGNFDFFFIDEGFGTLHEQALEQALEVLTRLSSSALVGLVTHRTELLGRIPVTLLVTQADETTGTTCRIV